MGAPPPGRMGIPFFSADSAARIQAAQSSGLVRVVSTAIWLGRGEVNVPGLPLGVRPVRGTVGTSGLALPQFLVVAEHLDGQQGDGFQPPKQILDPSGILADDMVDDGPCSGFRRRRDSA